VLDEITVAHGMLFRNRCLLGFIQFHDPSASKQTNVCSAAVGILGEE